MDEYDLVIVGSDEVWNLSHPWYGGCPLFYGEGIRARRLASYAASFGNYDASQPLHPAWRERLRAFDWISVRDENSRQIIQRELGIDPEFVLDPCLLYPTTVQQDADEDAPRLGANYVAVYGHNFPAHTIQAVRTWAQARGYPLVSIGYRNDWADQQWIAAGPAEFAHFMQDAVAVITNFFHGCVFALLNEKPFVCGLSDYRAHKIHDLMAAIGGERHLLAEDAPQIAYADCLDEPLDPAILHRIEMLRCTSHQFLGRMLLEALPEAVPA